MHLFWNGNLYPDNAPLGIASTCQFNENSFTFVRHLFFFLPSWKSFHCRIFAGTVYIGFAYIPAGPSLYDPPAPAPFRETSSPSSRSTIEIAMQKYAEIMLQRFVAIMCAPFERTRARFVRRPFFHVFIFMPMLPKCYALEICYWALCQSLCILCRLGRVYLSFCFILLFVFKNKSRWPYCLPTGWNGGRNASICIKIWIHLVLSIRCT